MGEATLSQGVLYEKIKQRFWSGEYMNKTKENKEKCYFCGKLYKQIKKHKCKRAEHYV